MTTLSPTFPLRYRSISSRAHAHHRNVPDEWPILTFPITNRSSYFSRWMAEKLLIESRLVTLRKCWISASITGTFLSFPFEGRNSARNFFRTAATNAFTGNYSSRLSSKPWSMAFRLFVQTLANQFSSWFCPKTSCYRFDSIQEKEDFTSLKKCFLYIQLQMQRDLIRSNVKRKKNYKKVCASRVHLLTYLRIFLYLWNSYRR